MRPKAPRDVLCLYGALIVEHSRTVLFECVKIAAGCAAFESADDEERYQCKSALKFEDVSESRRPTRLSSLHHTPTSWKGFFFFLEVLRAYAACAKKIRDESLRAGWILN